MPQSAPALILASSSPRRRSLLEKAGFTFRVDAPHVDESPKGSREPPEQMARRLALEKARTVASRSGSGCCVLAADTVVSLDGEILGKPEDPQQALAMLLRLSGRAHHVYTGVAVLCTGPDSESARSEQSAIVKTRVIFRMLSEVEARRYVSTGEPLDKAGAYAIQGRAEDFVADLSGSRTNVIGLPMETILPLLEQCGVLPG